MTDIISNTATFCNMHYSYPYNYMQYTISYRHQSMHTAGYNTFEFCLPMDAYKGIAIAISQLAVYLIIQLSLYVY